MDSKKQPYPFPHRWRGKSGGGHTSGRIRGAAGRGGEGAALGRQQVHRLLPRVRGPRSQSRRLA
jgi:hypothetical protein